MSRASASRQRNSRSLSMAPASTARLTYLKRWWRESEIEGERERVRGEKKKKKKSGHVSSRFLFASMPSSFFFSLFPSPHPHPPKKKSYQLFVRLCRPQVVPRSHLRQSHAFPSRQAGVVELRRGAKVRRGRGRIAAVVTCAAGEAVLWNVFGCFESSRCEQKTRIYASERDLGTECGKEKGARGGEKVLTFCGPFRAFDVFFFFFFFFERVKTSFARAEERAQAFSAALLSASV